jgi:hypothetical protein
MHAGAARQNGFLRVIGEDVAGARAISKLSNCVIGLHGPFELRMRHWTVLIGVAAGAIRPEGGEFPWDGLGIRGVAASAIERPPVIYVGW